MLLEVIGRQSTADDGKAEEASLTTWDIRYPSVTFRIGAARGLAGAAKVANVSCASAKTVAPCAPLGVADSDERAGLMGNTRWLALALASVVAGACSDGSKNVAPTPQGLATLDHITAAPVTLSTAPDAGVAPDASSPDLSYAVAIPMPPWTQCIIYPEGDSGDAAHTNIVSAGASGEVRFYPPSQDWGTRLSLDCTLNGSAQGSHLVDLNDASTFKHESQADLTPHVTGTRPALTGDLSALSLNDLLQTGYPPRPDSSNDPKGYSRWVKAVSQPATIFNGVTVGHLGARLGSLQFQVTTGNWTGFVQSANNFETPLASKIPTTLYNEYEMFMPVPVTSGCRFSGGCETAIWGGIGGVPVDTPGFGVVQTSLLQSGFWMVGSNPAEMVIEFAPPLPFTAPAPNGVMPPPGTVYAPADNFYVWGWAASDVSCTPDLRGGGAFGCFGFWDTTNNWSMAGADFALNQPQGIYLSATAEFIAEVLPTPPPQSRVQNTSYGYDYLYGAAYDTTGVEHPDPGAGGTDPSDPYVYTQQNDPSGNPYSTAVWYEGGITNAVDPMFFVWQNSN
jgi:hypothetical protein